MKTSKILSDIEKTKTKIGELQAKLRDLERLRTETENTEIIELVRAIDATPEEIGVMLRALRESQKQEAMKSLAPPLGDDSGDVEGTEDDTALADDGEDETEESDYEG